MIDQKITIPLLWEKKKKKEPIVCTSCYDYPIGLILDKVGVELVMVGDSVGMVVLGYENTVPVTMEEIIHHAKAVVKGCRRPFIIGDMPFGSYNSSREKAIENATRLMKEAGVDGVKVEGSDMTVIETVRALVKSGIPVMGHIGVTPQTVSQLGGYKVRGKGAAEALALIQAAGALEESGAFAIELECIPVPVSKIITEKLRVPTIGFGSGPWCDGQGLILYDILGLYHHPLPKLSKKYVNLIEIITEAMASFIGEITEKKFPTLDHSFSMPDKEYKLLLDELKKGRPNPSKQLV